MKVERGGERQFLEWAGDLSGIERALRFMQILKGLGGGMGHTLKKKKTKGGGGVCNYCSGGGKRKKNTVY